MSREGTRLLKLMGYNTPGLQSNIGLEQEFFLIPRDAFARRLDLQMTGRTVLGKNAVCVLLLSLRWPCLCRRSWWG
jgi:glutamine synthetase